MRIVMIGTGYVGLVSGACFADFGHEVVCALQDAGIHVKACDPEGMEQAKKVIDKVTYCEGPYKAMEGADAAVIVTEWDAFRALDLDRMKAC